MIPRHELVYSMTGELVYDDMNYYVRHELSYNDMNQQFDLYPSHNSISLHGNIRSTRGGNIEINTQRVIIIEMIQEIFDIFLNN